MLRTRQIEKLINPGGRKLYKLSRSGLRILGRQESLIYCCPCMIHGWKYFFYFIGITVQRATHVYKPLIYARGSCCRRTPKRGMMNFFGGFMGAKPINGLGAERAFLWGFLFDHAYIVTRIKDSYDDITDWSFISGI